jgi:hypothetical protein
MFLSLGQYKYFRLWNNRDPRVVLRLVFRTFGQTRQFTVHDNALLSQNQTLGKVVLSESGQGTVGALDFK